MPDYRPESYRIAVFCPTDRERQVALSILDPSNVEAAPADSLSPPVEGARRLHAYRGVFTSWCDESELEALRQANLVVDVMRPPVADAAAVQEPFERHDRLSRADPRAEKVIADSDRVAVGDAASGLTVTQEPGRFQESDDDMYLVSLRGPLDTDRRALLDSIGAHVTEYEPPNGYWMYLDRQQHRTLSEQWWVMQVRPRGWIGTVTADIAEVIAPARGVPGEATLLGEEAPPEPAPEQYDVLLHKAEHLEWVRDKLARTHGVEVVFAVDVMIRFKTTLAGDELSAMLAAVSRLHEVRDINPYRPPTLYVDHARTLTGLPAIAEPHAVGDPHAAGAPILDGTGQTVAIFDSGVDAAHPDLADRVIAKQALVGASPDDILGHGTHVAGIVVGTGKASNQALTGCAPGASLAAFRITDDEGLVQVPPDIGHFLKHAVEVGAKVINLSWGRRMSFGGYDGYALSLDKFVHEHPDVLVVVAAGNEGEAPEGMHLFNTIGTPATAKNALTVGASETDRAEFAGKTWAAFRGSRFPKPPAGAEHVAGEADVPAAMSGRGPTDSGGVKPDVLAPGTYILSTKLMSNPIDDRLVWEDYPEFGGHYVYIGGTSMAAPVVAGAAALLRQYLAQERGNPDPSAALLKAMLIAAARPLPSLRPSGSQEDVGYPDFDQGYGRLDLSTLLPCRDAPAGREMSYVDIANDSAEALEAFAPAGGNRVSSRAYRLNVTAGDDPLRLVLAWTDHPGNAVQNNLNLGVVTPDGKTLVGNLRHTFHKDAGLFDRHHIDQYKSQPLDKLNSVEHVAIENPVPGEYRVQVLAQVTAFPPQGYSLVACGQLDGELREEA